ncbi:hypothetical protein LOTGIDRAFT_106999, partial [Lottia gigantea]
HPYNSRAITLHILTILEPLHFTSLQSYSHYTSHPYNSRAITLHILTILESLYSTSLQF